MSIQDLGLDSSRDGILRMVKMCEVTKVLTSRAADNIRWLREVVEI